MGSRSTDVRGSEIIEWCARKDWNTYNDGLAPTFLCNSRASFIDVTLATPGIVQEWNVREDIESHSDYQYIEYRISLTRGGTEKTETALSKGWRGKNLDGAKLKLALDERCKALDDCPIQEKQITRILREACKEAATPARFGPARKKPAYWWNSEVAELRKGCLKARRRYLRLHKKKTARLYEFRESLKTYTEAKQSYKKEASKRRSWRSLCESVREDNWGLPYRIIRDKIGHRRLDILKERVERVVRELLPPGQEFERGLPPVKTEEVPEVSDVEIDSGRTHGDGEGPWPL